MPRGGCRVGWPTRCALLVVRVAAAAAVVQTVQAGEPKDLVAIHLVIFYTSALWRAEEEPERGEGRMGRERERESKRERDSENGREGGQIQIERERKKEGER